MFLCLTVNNTEAQSLSERIDKIEWEHPITHQPIFGWEAIYHYSTYNGRAFKVLGGGFVTYGIIDNVVYTNKYSCKQSWLQRRRARRQFKRRRKDEYY